MFLQHSIQSGASATQKALIQAVASNRGALYDIQDLTTLCQTYNGTSGNVAVGDPVGRVDDKSGNGNDAEQQTSASRPVLRQDSNGNYYLEFDGVDDFLTIPGSDSAFKFMHDGTGGSFVGAFSVDMATDTGTYMVFYSSSEQANTNTGALSYFNDITTSSAVHAITITNGSGSTFVDVAVSGNGALPRNESFVLRNEFSSVTLGFVNGAQTVNNTPSGSPSTANSSSDMSIGVREPTAGGYFKGNFYGGLFVGSSLTESQAFNADRYYAQISGATL